MLTKGTRIRSLFLTKELQKEYGYIEGYQENNGVLVEGYFVKFDDYPTALFMSIHVISELYEVIEENLDEDVFKVNDNGQISFI